MKAILAPGLLGVGLLMVLLSFAWGSIVPAGTGWSDEQSQRLRELEDEIVDMYVKIEAAKNRGEQIDGEPPQYKALIDERIELRTAFEKSKNAGSGSATVLRYGGVALVVAGVIANAVIKKD